MSKILVLDNEKEIADVIGLYLRNDGYEVELAYSGREALKKVETSPPDLALLDVMLPDIDGFRVLQKIREKYKFPVIMLTAKTEYTDKINGLTLGGGRLYPEAVQSAGDGGAGQGAASPLSEIQWDCCGTAGEYHRLRRAFDEPRYARVQLQ